MTVHVCNTDIFINHEIDFWTVFFEIPSFGNLSVSNHILSLFVSVQLSCPFDVITEPLGWYLNSFFLYFSNYLFPALDWVLCYIRPLQKGTTSIRWNSSVRHCDKKRKRLFDFIRNFFETLGAWPFCQQGVSPTRTWVNWSFRQMVILWIGHFVNRSFD